jgi:hypothetical protein
MKILALLLALLLFAAPAAAQVPGTGAPMIPNAAPSSGASTITSGTTLVAGATNGNCLYNNAGTLGDKACGGTITANSTATSGFAAGQILYSDGSKVQAAGVTGSLGSVVLSVSPTFTGVVGFAAGLSGAPSINLGSATTGLFASAANRIDFSISGNGILRIAGTTVVTNSVVGGFGTSNSNGTMAYQLGGYGTNYFGLAPTTNDASCLGWNPGGAGQGTMTCAITWTDNAAVTIAPSAGVVMLGSGTAAAGNTGEVGMPKITASGSAPGAAAAKMEWTVGTNGGTCKLISYAGTSTTPVTIVDNVGGGC